MIIIKDVPGLSHREVIDALLDLTDPNDPTIVTGHGGFVVDENVAERFLSAYLIAAGKRPAPTGVTAGNEAPTRPAPARTPTRRAGRRKEVA
jgi:hypothetical protein